MTTPSLPVVGGGVIGGVSGGGGGDGSVQQPEVETELWCICEHPWIGRMVGCDNPECPIQW